MASTIRSRVGAASVVVLKGEAPVLQKAGIWRSARWPVRSDRLEGSGRSVFEEDLDPSLCLFYGAARGPGELHSLFE